MSTQASARSGATISSDIVNTLPFPATTGYETSGVIDAVGPAISGSEVGDSAAVIPAIMFDK